MPQISNSGTNELYQAPTFDDILFKIYYTDSTTVLKRLHHGITIELQFRSSHPNSCNDPDFFNLTDEELAAAACKILAKVMDILSCMQLAYHAMRYAKRRLHRVSSGLLCYLVICTKMRGGKILAIVSGKMGRHILPVTMGPFIIVMTRSMSKYLICSFGCNHLGADALYNLYVSSPPVSFPPATSSLLAVF